MRTPAILTTAALLFTATAAQAQTPALTPPKLRLTPDALAKIKAKTGVSLARPAPKRRKTAPKPGTTIRLKRPRYMTSSDQKKALREAFQRAAEIKRPFTISPLRPKVLGKYELYALGVDGYRFDRLSFFAPNKGSVEMYLDNLKVGYVYVFECNMTTHANNTYVSISEGSSQISRLVAVRSGDMFTFLHTAQQKKATFQIYLQGVAEHWAFKGCRVTPAVPAR